MQAASHFLFRKITARRDGVIVFGTPGVVFGKHLSKVISGSLAPIVFPLPLMLSLFLFIT